MRGSEQSPTAFLESAFSIKHPPLIKRFFCGFMERKGKEKNEKIDFMGEGLKEKCFIEKV